MIADKEISASLAEIRTAAFEDLMSKEGPSPARIDSYLDQSAQHMAVLADRIIQLARLSSEIPQLHELAISAAKELSKVHALHDQIASEFKSFDISKQDLDPRDDLHAKDHFSLSMGAVATDSLVLSLDNIVFELDSEQKFTNVWTQGEPDLPLSLTRVIGRNLSEVFPTAVSRLIKRAIAEAGTSSEPVEWEYATPVQPGGTPESWHRAKVLKQQRDGQKDFFTIVISDITAEKAPLLHDNLTSKELESFFKVALEMLCITDIDWNLKKLNPVWSQALGYTDAELRDQSMLDLVHPDDLEATKHEAKKFTVGIQTTRFENRLRAKDGSYRILSWATTVDRELSLLYSAARDITESRRRESEIRQILDAIYRSAIVALTDQKGRIIEVNDNFCAISGFSREELIGQDHRIVNSGRHNKDFFRDLWKTISAGKAWSGEIVNRAKDGSLYSVQSVLSPLIGINGKVERYLAIRFDITKQRESERLLSEAERVAKIGSWTFDIASQKVRWSPQMFELFEENEAKGPPNFEEHFSSVHPEDQAMWQEKVSTALTQGTAYKFRFRSTQQGDKVKWIEAIGEARKGPDDMIIALSGTCQDVTELVRVEENLRIERAKAIHNAKLASLGEMSAGVAHEINNPLSIIAGAVHFLSKAHPDPAKLKSKLDTIDKASQRIAKIVGGLRKFSRTSDKNAAKVHKIRRIIEEAIVMTGAKLRRHSTELHFLCEGDPSILCDELGIEQVLINLINNAVDAVKNRDSRWVKIKVFSSGFSVVIQLHDSGPGIPPEHRDRLFQPFFTTKPVGESTGLGLAIVKGILDEHRALISLLTQEDHTCFEIRFRQAEELEVAA